MPISTEQLDKIFFALADPTRRAILQRLSDHPRAVNDLENPYNISMPAISKHLRVLEAAGLVTQRKEGNKRWCILKPKALKDANDWLSGYRAFWDMQLDAFKKYMEGQDWKVEKKPSENQPKEKQKPKINLNKPRNTKKNENPQPG
ncbi:MAG: helix-turn-helix transcriptional regulator [bacterium]|nr:helix-turn-helix transcriptional regulator [bacterium]